MYLCCVIRLGLRLSAHSPRFGKATSQHSVPCAGVFGCIAFAPRWCESLHLCHVPVNVKASTSVSVIAHDMICDLQCVHSPSCHNTSAHKGNHLKQVKACGWATAESMLTCHMDCPDFCHTHNFSIHRFACVVYPACRTFMLRTFRPEFAVPSTGLAFLPHTYALLFKKR